jgi:hypothetical protein
VFATQRDATPGSVPGNNLNRRKSANQANYFNASFAVTQTITPSASQNYLTDVGAFSKSASYYGTFDQAGNVYEWNDPQGPGQPRSLRGAYWVSNVADTSYLDAYYLPAEYESNGSGFRLASRVSRGSFGLDPIINPQNINAGRLGRGSGSGSRLSGREGQAASLVSAPGWKELLGIGFNSSGDQHALGPLAGEPPLTTILLANSGQL